MFGLERLRLKAADRDAELSGLQFLDRGDEQTSRPPSPVAGRVALVICALVSAAVAGLWFGRVDIYATAAGRVQPVGRSKVVQPMDVGRILSVAVRNGAHVRAGDLLIELDQTEQSADRVASAEESSTLAAEIAMRQAGVDAVRHGRILPVPEIAFPAGTDVQVQSLQEAYLRAGLSNLDQQLRSLDAQVAEKRTEEDGLRSRIAKRDTVIDTLNERVRMRAQLETEGWDSKANLIDAQETLERENTQRADDSGTLADTAAEIVTLSQQRAQVLTAFIDTNEQAIAAAQSKLVMAERDLRKSDARLRDTQLVAPVSGTVQDLDVTTIGQVVNAGQQLMTIVPDSGPLQVEAAVLNTDVGFVRPGQNVVVKVDTFPFTQYGVMNGVVTRVARDAIDSTEAQALSDRRSRGLTTDQSAGSPAPTTRNLVFPVTIELDQPWLTVKGKRTYLTPGMTVTAEIKTGNRRAIDYLLAPFLETTSNAFHER